MFQHGDIKIEGTSVSGVTTSLMVSLPGFKFLMDIGTNLPDATKCQYVFITHAHIDHMGAAPQHAATRDMMAMPPTKFICSTEVAQGLEKILRVWQEVQGGFKYEILTLNPGERMRVCQNLQVQAFSTFHRVPSQGYAFIRETSKLKPEYVGMSGPEVGKLVRSGVEVKTLVESVEAVFTGDTTSYLYLDTVISNDFKLFRKAKLVVAEATFVDESVSVEEARKKGHTHLSEIKPEWFASCEKVIFTHFSNRHSTEEIEKAMSWFPKEFREKISTI